MTIQEATAKYERWLGRKTRIVREDLERKHQRMRENLFSFFRASYYRWIQHWPQTCAALAAAPEVLATGDLHVENFGTWRDAEGRLVWGVNDFDEAADLAYTVDLVRLAASAQLAAEEAVLRLGHEEACTAILHGYREGLESGGRPFILGERQHWLRRAVLKEQADPHHFWERIQRAAPLDQPRRSVMRLLDCAMPERGPVSTVAHRVAGLGSLGRERYIAIAEWSGGRVVREIKALTPPASRWAGGAKGAIRYATMLDRAVRARDPLVSVESKWLVRRLAPDCIRLELGELQRDRDEVRLLRAMGWETANVHLGTRGAASRILVDLAKRREDWLLAASRKMLRLLRRDWEAWRRD